MRHLSFNHPFNFKQSVYLLFSVIFLTAQTFAAGVIDTTFGTNGTVTTEIGRSTYLTDTLMQPDNKIIVAGSYTELNNRYRNILVRYNPDGTLDETFGSNGKAILVTRQTTYIYAVGLQPDGKIIGAGVTYRRSDEGSLPDYFAFRFTANGMLDTTFGDNGVFTYDIGVVAQSKERATSLL